MSSIEALVKDLELSVSEEAILESMDVCAGDDADGATLAGWTVPPVVNLIAQWALQQAKNYGCENREMIIGAVRQFVMAKVTNPMLQAMILAAVETMVLQLCG